MYSLVDHHVWRRIVIHAMSVGVAGAAAHLALPGSLHATRLRQSPEVATPEGVDGLAGTPLGEQMTWFIDAVNTGGTSLTVAEIEEHMAPSILDVLPPEQAIATIQGLAAGFGALTLEGVTRPPTATQAVALVMAGIGVQVALPIRVEEAAPFRITGLVIYPAPSATGEPLLPLPAGGMDAPALADLADIGGRSLYYVDTGTEGPTVVLESGLGDPAASWTGLIPDIAAFTRVVSYDRPNTEASASDPASPPRTGADVVADLHTMLEIAAIPGPYVLVGHSIGGSFARLYASQYPDEVAGLVLVDATHEDQFTRLVDVVSPELMEMVAQMTGANTEGIDLDASLAQVAEARATTPLQPMPLVALSAGQADPGGWPEGWPLEETHQLHLQLQEDLASLVPGGRLVIAEQSGHYVHHTQPDLVLDAIRQVVDGVRDPASWATPPAGTPAS